MKTFQTALLVASTLLGSLQTAGARPHWHPRPPVYRPPIYSPPIYSPPIYVPSPTPRERKEVQAQIRLRQLGYYHGPIDGDIGPYTSRAISRFQYDRGLPVTGWLDVRTLRALGVI